MSVTVNEYVSGYPCTAASGPEDPEWLQARTHIYIHTRRRDTHAPTYIYIHTRRRDTHAPTYTYIHAGVTHTHPHIHTYTQA